MTDTPLWRQQAKDELREIIARCYAALPDQRETRESCAAQLEEVARLCMSLKAKLEENG